MPIVSIIIPNLSGEDLLRDCLDGIKQLKYGDYEIILVDNGSEDHSIEVAKAAVPDIKVVVNSSNLGFSGAVRRGMEATRGKYIAVLNNDAVPEPGWLDAMIRAIESDPQVGMVACRVLNDDGTQIDSLGLGAAQNGMAVLIGHGELLSSPPRYPGGNERGGALAGEPFGPAGAAGMYRREMLDQFGGFPERFFCYYEDLWVAWQGRLRGWKCVLAKDAVVRHLGYGTPLEGWKSRSYWIALNKWRTILSCWTFGLLFRYAPAIIWWDLLAKIGEIFSGRFIQAVASRVRAFSELGYWLKVRKGWKAELKVSPKECQQWLIPSPKLRDLAGRRRK